MTKEPEIERDADSPDSEIEDLVPVEEESETKAEEDSGDSSEGGEGAAAEPGRAKSDRIAGIFSTQSVQKVGTGTTVRKSIQKTFWMVDELANGVIEIQPLNVNYIPSGPKRRIDKDYLLNKFSPEPEFYVHTVFPAIQELNRTVDKGEEHREKGEVFSAEHQFNKALKVDVENVRANFGLGLTYLSRGDTAKADNIFERLVKLDAAFEEEHKHLFNDFGISLRKNKMIDQALEYYDKAKKLARDDENLHYNIARALFEKGLVQEAVKELENALKMNPNLEPARQFLAWCETKGLTKGTAAPPSSGNGDKSAGPDGEGRTDKKEAAEPDDSAPIDFNVD